MKRIQFLLFSSLSVLIFSCGSSAHFMKDDVYQTKTPMVPLGTDLRDETDYAAYAYKRDRVQEKVEYQATDMRWNQFRNSTVVFSNGIVYNRMSTGFVFSPTFYTINGMTYNGFSYASGGHYYGFFGNPYLGGYPYYFNSPWCNGGYNSYYGFNPYGYAYYNYYGNNQLNKYHPTSFNNQSAQGTTRGLTTSAPNYGNNPRLIRTNQAVVSNGTAVRSTPSGSINSGTTRGDMRNVDRSTNTAVRVEPTSTGTSGNSSRSNGSYTDRGNSSSSNRGTTSSPTRNPGTTTTTPQRGSSSPRMSTPSGGGGRSGGSTGSPAGGRSTGGRR